MTNTSKPVPCPSCAEPIAKLIRGDDGVVRLVLVARHHSNKHTVAYTVEQLRALWESFDADTRHNT